MAKTKIPEDIQEKANRIIADFNSKTYKKKSGMEYYAIYKGNFLYLNRREGDRDGPIARLKYTGKFDDWNFAIFKWSSERYDPDEVFFPGEQHLDGTIEGALKAGNAAYPPSWEPSRKEMLAFFKQFLGN
ncbi:MAG: hypothetical protein M0Q51_16675 [Bacteroidales bacterium]|nr:hypothetical protein [Bacteroidales bacterium]